MSGASVIAMHWDCQRQGCFNQKKRLKFSVFKDCLPGRISFADVDGLVEINGNLLLLEWKDHEQLSTGQRILYQRMTRLCPAGVFLVEGDAEDMSVQSLSTVWAGVIGPREPIDLEGLCGYIRTWADWAKTHPAKPRALEPSCN